ALPVHIAARQIGAFACLIPPDQPLIGAVALEVEDRIRHVAVRVRRRLSRDVVVMHDQDRLCVLALSCVVGHASCAPFGLLSLPAFCDASGTLSLARPHQHASASVYSNVICPATRSSLTALMSARYSARRSSRVMPSSVEV